MQIIVKLALAAGARKGLVDVGRTVRDWLDGRGKKAPRKLSVGKLFPRDKDAELARLYTVDLPEDLSDHDVRGVVASLADLTSLEYAQIPAKRQ